MSLLCVVGLFLGLWVVPGCDAAMALCTRLLSTCPRCRSVSVLKRMFLEDALSFEPVQLDEFPVDPVRVKSEADETARQAALRGETDRSPLKALPDELQGCGSMAGIGSRIRSCACPEDGLILVICCYSRQCSSSLTCSCIVSSGWPGEH